MRDCEEAVLGQGKLKNSAKDRAEQDGRESASRGHLLVGGDVANSGVSLVVFSRLFLALTHPGNFYGMAWNGHKLLIYWSANVDVSRRRAGARVHKSHPRSQYRVKTTTHTPNGVYGTKRTLGPVTATARERTYDNQIPLS